jgi:multidrug efflux pump subunit AcrA (membrane-fusion protein)
MSARNVDWNRIFEFAWRILVFIVAVVIIVVVSSSWNRWEGAEGWQRATDAYLQSDLTPISSKVAGYIRELPIQDFEHVHKGQVLARLVDDDYRAAVAQAQASIASATGALLEQNARDTDRQQRLLRTGSSSTEAGEKLETVHAQLQAQLAENQAQARAAERQLGVLEAQLTQSQASLQAAHAALASFDSVVLTALKETEQALSTYSAALDHRQALADAQQSIHRSFDIAQSAFVAGSLSTVDLLTTEQSLVALDAAVAASDGELAQDQIAFFKALGGGWQRQDTAAASP